MTILSTIYRIECLALTIIMIYNCLTTGISVMNFSEQDVKKVCPYSELWWCASVVGLLIPVIGSKISYKLVKKTMTEKKIALKYVFLYFGVFASCIAWSWRELWGWNNIPLLGDNGNVNDCPMNNWENKNSTSGDSNMNYEDGGYYLFTAVERWLYLYLVLEVFLVLSLCSGFIVISSTKNTVPVHQPVSTNENSSPTTTKSQQLGHEEAEKIRLTNLLTTGYPEGVPI